MRIIDVRGREGISRGRQKQTMIKRQADDFTQSDLKGAQKESERSKR